MARPIDRPIDELTELMAAQGVIREQLVAALYVLRAHRSLRGIGLAIDHFFRLADGRFRALLSCAEIKDYDARLSVLRRVAEVTQTVLEFNAGSLAGRDINQQLRPHCGDSGITDMLLVWHGAGGARDNDDFDQIVAWFVWQGIRFNRKKLTELEYSNYLHGDDSSRLLEDSKDGRQIYNAGLKLRKLGDSTYRDALSKAVKLGLDLDEPKAKSLARVLRVGARIREEERSRWRESLRKEPGFDQGRFLAEIKDAKGIFDIEVTQFLASLWWGHLLSTRKGTTRVMTDGVVRERFKPVLKRAPSLTEVITPIDTGVLGGIAVDFISMPQRIIGDKEANDDPDIAEGAEPAATVFLGDGDDLLKAYYASKGAQCAIEYNNALLPWSHWRISRDAVDAVLALVRVIEGESDIELMARLAVGLSLLSGRPFEAVALPVFGSSKVTREDPVAVDVAKGVLTVFAGTPKLKKKVEMLELCDPHGDAVRLALLPAWQPLIERCSQMKLKKHSAVVSAARRLLRQLPPALAVTEKGVRIRLATELLRLSRGDLGLVKLITDSTDANLQNLIHYASYRTAMAESQWRQAASALAGPLPEDLPAPPPGERVGAPHGFNVDLLREYFTSTRQRFEAHVGAKRWREAFNYLTMQTAQWIALATAGRKTASPIPRILLSGRWAFTDDKHVSDGSTDRIVPFGVRLEAQLAAYAAFASHLSLTYPALQPFVQTAGGWELRLWYISKSGEVRPYRPHYQEGSRVPKRLPGNWARKLVRSEATELYGRMTDAGSGHMVRGRNPWRFTSTLSTPVFVKAWLDLQASLETRLGLEPLVVPGFSDTPRRFLPRLPPAASRLAAPKERDPESKNLLPDNVVQDRFKVVDAQRYAEVFDAKPPDRVAALELIRALVRQLYESDVPDLGLWVESACTLIRSKTGLPIFGSRPRALFAKDWLLDGEALQILAWFEAHVLPKFEAELRQLPAPREPSSEEERPKPRAEWAPRTKRAAAEQARAALAASASTDAAKPEPASGDEPAGASSPSPDDTGDPADEVVDLATMEGRGEDGRLLPIDRFDHPDLLELGRLIMIGVWRLGLNRQPILEVFLRWVAGTEPILVSGSLRYVQLTAPCRRTSQVMNRTLYFDNFTAAYLQIERDRLRPVIQQVFGLRRGRRHRRWYTAVKPYLASIGAPTPALTLPKMMLAAVQRVMLRSSPILAAYSCGEFATEDLGDKEIRRLAGLPPRPAPTGKGAGGQKPAASLDEHDSEESELIPVDEAVPEDLRKAKHNFGYALTGARSSLHGELKRRLVVMSLKLNTERLLRSFALYLLELEKGALDKGKLPEARREEWARLVHVVSDGLMGMADTVGDLSRIDMGDLQRLSEATSEHFSDQDVSQAWSAFKAFLRRKQANLSKRNARRRREGKPEEKVDQDGVVIGDIGRDSDYNVSAKILTVDMILQIEERFGSVRSGISNPRHRESARKLFCKIADTGLRRAEGQYTPTLDAQGDLVRIQANDDRSLKTTWSERVYPVGFLQETTRADVSAAREQGLRMLVDAVPTETTEGYHVFDAINRVIQEVGGDEELGLHHLRHTMASRLLLSVLADAVDFDGIAEDLPWVKPLLIRGERLELLLGYEGPSGHGMQVTSAVLGHSHTTTSLKHYVHTLGITFYAFMMQLEAQEDISRSFALRMRSEKTFERWGAEARKAAEAIADLVQCQAAINRWMRNRIERALLQDQTAAAGAKPKGKTKEVAAPVEPAPDVNALTFDRLEKLEQALRGKRPVPGDPWFERLRDGLEWLSSIPSGKAGAKSPRHPMERAGCLAPLPKELKAHSGADSAQAVVSFLEALRTCAPDDFTWLLRKWAYASEVERGRMRLDSEEEIRRVRKLVGNHGLSIEVKEAAVQPSREGARPTPRMRLRFIDDKKFSRDTHAIRWGLTLVTALYGKA